MASQSIGVNEALAHRISEALTELTPSQLADRVVALQQEPTAVLLALLACHGDVLQVIPCSAARISRRLLTISGCCSLCLAANTLSQVRIWGRASMHHRCTEPAPSVLDVVI